MESPGLGSPTHYRAQVAAGRRARLRPLRRIGFSMGVVILIAAVAGPFLLRSSPALPGGGTGLAVWRNDNDPGPWSTPWDGSAFDPDQATADLGEWRIIRGAASPVRDEAFVLGIAAAKDVRGQMWNGISWAPLPFDPLAQPLAG